MLSVGNRNKKTWHSVGRIVNQQQTRCPRYREQESSWPQIFTMLCCFLHTDVPLEKLSNMPALKTINMKSNPLEGHPNNSSLSFELVIDLWFFHRYVDKSEFDHKRTFYCFFFFVLGFLDTVKYLSNTNRRKALKYLLFILQWLVYNLYWHYITPFDAFWCSWI